MRSAGALVLVVLLGCGGPAGNEPLESTTDAGPVIVDAGAPDGGAGPDFSELSAYLTQVESQRLINGYAMQVFDRDDRLVFERSFGRCVTPGPCPAGSPAYTPTLITGIASSTKWVTSTVALAVIDERVRQGRVSSVAAGLDERVVPSLACAGATTGPYRDLTLRQLLSFTDGLVASHVCSTDRSQTLQACACRILADSAASFLADPAAGHPSRNGHPPGSTFKYGDAHHAVVGAVLEKWTGASFESLFERLVRAPLNVTMNYKSRVNLAGSIDTSVADFAVFVRAIAHDGRGLEAPRLVSKAAVEEQRALQVAPSVVLRSTPQEGGAYGLNTWRWCYRAFTSPDPMQAEVDSSCSEVFLSGHGGKGGFSPFVSVPLGYSAVFAMREDQSAAGEGYAAEQVGITSRVRFFTQRAFAR
ncbi:MAG: serine hydrolase domain-containing protein [Myxococcales bacterium]|nr:serine hydrolase domain-containing protein [Myxococcales bacterium]